MTLKIPLGPVMTDVAGLALTDDDIKRLQHPLVGGMILFARNFESPEQLKRLTTAIHALREPRLAIAVAIGCGLPFALQSPAYVTQQFTDWAGRVGDDDRTEQPMERGYHDFQ